MSFSKFKVVFSNLELVKLCVQRRSSRPAPLVQLHPPPRAAAEVHAQAHICRPFRDENHTLLGGANETVSEAQRKRSARLRARTSAARGPSAAFFPAGTCDGQWSPATLCRAVAANTARSPRTGAHTPRAAVPRVGLISRMPVARPRKRSPER